MYKGYLGLLLREGYGLSSMSTESTAKRGLFSFISSIFSAPAKEAETPEIAMNGTIANARDYNVTEELPLAMSQVNETPEAEPETKEPPQIESSPVDEPLTDEPPAEESPAQEPAAETLPTHVLLSEEDKKGEVKAMYCDKCGYQLEQGSTTCNWCNPKEANNEAANNVEVASYDPAPITGDGCDTPDTTTIDVPVQDHPESEPNPCTEAAPCEEPPAPCQEPCEPTCESECEPCEPQLNYAEKKAKKARLALEIEELRRQVQPCLDELTRLTSCASAEEYSSSLNSIDEALDQARKIECALQSTITEYDGIIVNSCCEHGWGSADKYCGICGEYLGGIGWLCPSCTTLNKDDNGFCRGCGYTPGPKEAASPTEPQVISWV